MASKKDYEVIASDNVITPTRGSVFFTIKHPLVEYQTVGWVLGQLEWKEKTLIDPFLTDLRFFLENRLTSVKSLKKREIEEIWLELKNRFFDWQIKMGLIFKKKNNLLEFFICGQLYVYLILENKFRQMPLNKKEVNHFYLSPQKNVGVLIVDQLLPENVVLEDLDEFVNLLKNRSVSFVIFIPQRKKSKTSLLFNAKRIIHGHYPFVLSIFTLIFLVFIILLINRFYGHTQTKLINTLPNRPLQENQVNTRDARRLLAETYRLVDLNPEQARLNLIKIKILAQKQKITDKKFWRKVLELDKKLNNFSANQKFLLFNDNIFFPDGGGVWHDQVVFYTKNDIIDYSPQNQGHLIYHSPVGIVDLQVKDGHLYFLTTKGIFLLQDINDVKEIALIPKGVRGNQIDVYAGNIYLLDRRGEVYKYPRGAINPPSQPQLYFYSPELKNSRQMVVSKKFYFLTNSGRFVVYYFGKKQSFTFDKEIEPLQSFYFNDSDRLFYFLSADSCGFFDGVGRVMARKKLEEAYDEIVGYKKEVFLIKDNYFKKISL